MSHTGVCGKAMHELKKDMRTWAKSNAANDISLLRSLEEPETISLNDALSRIVVLKEGQLPDAILKNVKAPLILLNALLAHDVYRSFFVNPSSFLGEQAAQELTSIYQRTQAVIEVKMSKLKRLYNEAARQSYLLWTRRINMACLVLQQMENLTFNVESTKYDSDPLVRYDKDLNELNGRKIVVLMHPILVVSGNDNRDNYDQDSALTKGAVWLDGKND